MTIEAKCKSKVTALTILETIIKAMKPGAQKDALEAVAEFVEKAIADDSLFKMTPEEKDLRIMEILSEQRDCMNAEERREMADFYLEGIENV